MFLRNFNKIKNNTFKFFITKTTKIQSAIPSPIYPLHAVHQNFFHSNPKFQTSRRNWDGIFGSWGEPLSNNDNAQDRNLYDIEPIVTSLNQVKDGLNVAINQPILEIMRFHNHSIRAIESAANKNQYLILTKSDHVRQRLVLEELRIIRNFYTDFCSSEKFNNMERRLTTCVGDIYLNSRTLAEKIAIIRRLRKEHELAIQRIEQLPQDNITRIEIKKYGQQIRLRNAAIAALEKYKNSIDNLPPQLSSIKTIVTVFCATVKANKDVLITACEVMELLGNIQEGIAAINALGSIDETCRQIEDSWEAIGNTIDIFSQGIQNEIDRNLKNQENIIDITSQEMRIPNRK